MREPFNQPHTCIQHAYNQHARIMRLCNHHAAREHMVSIQTTRHDTVRSDITGTRARNNTHLADVRATRDVADSILQTHLSLMHSLSHNQRERTFRMYSLGCAVYLQMWLCSLAEHNVSVVNRGVQPEHTARYYEATVATNESRSR